MGGFDVAAIAIGGYEPRWFMKESHLNPSEALQVIKDVKARSAIKIHWGTFDGLSDDSLDQALKDLEIAKKSSAESLDFIVVKQGQTLVMKK